MKSILFKSFLLAIIATMLPQLASAYDFIVDDIAYNYNDDGASVSVTDGISYNYYNGDIIIPENVTYNGISYSVTKIGELAFADCSGLTSVTIPNSVTEIGLWAFAGCTGLTSATIPNSVTEIGEGTFSECTGLTSVTIPNSVTEIGEGTFSECTGLTSVTIPNSVTTIGGYTFSNCSGLTSVTIPNSVTSIDENPFINCPSLSSIIVDAGNRKFDSRDNCNAIIKTATNILIAGCMNTVIPNSVTSIGESAFRGCSGLTSMVVESGNTKYDSRNNCNAIIETATNTLIAGCMNTVIPNSVTAIGGAAFSGCSGLTSVTIPNSVTSIGYAAFSGCTGLTSMTIPNSVTSVGNEAFSGCTGLTSVTIPNSVTSIGDHAFSRCTGLTSVYSKIKNPETVSYGSDIFYEVPTSQCLLYVPKDTHDIYSTTSPWSSFSNIIEMAPDGDVNGDGHVSSVDVTALYNYLLNDDSSDIVNGDQDGDGHITSTDITVIYNLILGN